MLSILSAFVWRWHFVQYVLTSFCQRDLPLRQGWAYNIHAEYPQHTTNIGETLISSGGLSFSSQKADLCNISLFFHTSSGVTHHTAALLAKTAQLNMENLVKHFI